MRGGWVDIMTNRPDGVLDTGVTSDLARRAFEHRVGSVDGFTRRYALKRSVLTESYPDIRDAIQRERNIKRWPRACKVRLIHAANPDWRDPYEDLNARVDEKTWMDFNLYFFSRMGPGLCRPLGVAAAAASPQGEAVRPFASTVLLFSVSFSLFFLFSSFFFFSEALVFFFPFLFLPFFLFFRAHCRLLLLFLFFSHEAGVSLVFFLAYFVFRCGRRSTIPAAASRRVSRRSRLSFGPRLAGRVVDLRRQLSYLLSSLSSFLFFLSGTSPAMTAESQQRYFGASDQLRGLR